MHRNIHLGSLETFFFLSATPQIIVLSGPQRWWIIPQGIVASQVAEVNKFKVGAHSGPQTRLHGTITFCGQLAKRTRTVRDRNLERFRNACLWLRLRLEHI